MAGTCNAKAVHALRYHSSGSGGAVPMPKWYGLQGLIIITPADQHTLTFFHMLHVRGQLIAGLPCAC
jgi:hypothetical protein